MKITNIISILLISMFLWMAISWVDIVSDNNTSNPEHSDLNFFTTFCCEHNNL